MKSIVLCERTLVHESEDFRPLKDGKLNKDEQEKAEEKIINGISDSIKSETVINNSREAGKSNHHGSNESSQTFKEEVGEGDGKTCRSPNEVGNGTSKNSASNGKDSSVANARYNLCSDGGEKDRLVCETNSSTEDKIAETDVQSGSRRVQGLNLNNEGDISVINIEPCVETSEIDKSGLKSATNERKVNNSLENSDNSPLEQSFASDIAQSKEESNKRSVVNIDVDVDENKENEKEGKRNEIEEFLGNDSLNKQSRGCEIQVGDVQSITGSEKDSMWADNDFKSSEQNLMETAGEKLNVTPENISSPNENVPEDEKENRELEMDETVVSEAEENVTGMLLDEEEKEEEDEDEEEEEEEEESERVQDAINEKRAHDFTDLDKLSDNEIITVDKRKMKTGQRKKENGVCRKRHMSEEDVSDSSVKKKRFSTEDENMEDSSRCEGLASLGQTSSEAGRPATNRTSADDKSGKKLKASMGCEESKAKKFSILEKFRGTLKTLTRSDLEELIVQKLCEVITERSNVGELRRKAQALEEDQERWKTKIQSLTKQMREMEMVMKKYMTEVQKQVKDGDTHVVTPLKVTRSVGLQVSFYSSANKGPKPGLSQPAVPSSPSQNLNARNAKGTLPKIPSQFGSPNQNVRNKPVTYQKGSPNLHKASVSQQRRSIVPKPDYVSHRAMQQSLLSSSRGVQNQVPRATYKSISGTTAMTTATAAATTTTTTTTTTATMTASSTAQQQQQQNGSKVIDLTDDDDRQTGNVLKTSGPIRVVNHLSQAPAPQSNRFAYLLPTTNASTGTSGGQSRQVLIATPTMPQSSRQIMCSMPPLLFKGGNVIQSGAQTHVVNQSNKVVLPKALRHPAPLPQQPINQNTRPNLKLLPPRPALKISKVQTGIVLSWNMSLSSEHAPIASYQLYAYQESNSPPATSLWKKVGDVKALPLPMACTLTQFMSGHKYHFAVRAVDLHSRIGPFSFPGTIVLVK